MQKFIQNIAKNRINNLHKNTKIQYTIQSPTKNKKQNN
jgi:hypothetical protein